MADSNTSDATQNTDAAKQDDASQNNTTPSQGGSADDKPKFFTQDDVDKLMARTRREEKAKYEKQIADANKSETERLQTELAQLKSEKAERESKDEVIALLSKGGCKRPEAAYLLIRSSISRGKDGALEDTKALIAEAKEIAPEFFDDSPKRTGSADAGKQGDGAIKSVGQKFNDAIREAAGYKVH